MSLLTHMANLCFFVMAKRHLLFLSWGRASLDLKVVAESMIHLWLLTPAGALSFSFHEEETVFQETFSFQKTKRVIILIAILGTFKGKKGVMKKLMGKKNLVLWLLTPASH